MPNPSSPLAVDPSVTAIPNVLRYPLQGPALYAILAMTAGNVLALLPGVGWLIGIVTWVAAFRYAFEILRESADGRDKPPENLLGSTDGTAWRFLGVLVLAQLLVWWVSIIFGVPAWLCWLVLVVLQPGITIALAIDGSLLRALNPKNTLALFERIGSPFVATWLQLFAIQAGAILVGRLLVRWLPSVLGDAALAFVLVWGVFAAFRLTGSLVYRFHEALDHEPGSLGNAPLDRFAADRSLIEEAQDLVREGHPTAAIALLQEHVDTRAVSLPVHQHFHDLLRMQSDPARWEAHARQFLHRLLSEGEQQRALTLLREMRGGDPDFVPHQAEQARQLVAFALQADQPRLAIDTLLALIRSQPRAPDAAAWALDAATMLVDRYQEHERARDVLQQARLQCQDDELCTRLDAALASLPATPHLPSAPPAGTP